MSAEQIECVICGTRSDRRYCSNTCARADNPEPLR